MAPGFSAWDGDASDSKNPLTVTINSNKVITASFTKRPWLHGEGNAGMLSWDLFPLTLTAELVGQHQILGATNLLDWLPVGVLTNTYGTVRFFKPEQHCW